MLALPEFDTYHVLKRYAETASLEDGLALRWLKCSVENTLYWRSFSSLGAEHITEGVRLQLMNLKEDDTAATNTTQDIMQMTPEQQIAYYKEACLKAGLKIPEEVTGLTDKPESTAS